MNPVATLFRCEILLRIEGLLSNARCSHERKAVKSCLAFKLLVVFTGLPPVCVAGWRCLRSGVGSRLARYRDSSDTRPITLALDTRTFGYRNKSTHK